MRAVVGGGVEMGEANGMCSAGAVDPSTLSRTLECDDAASTSSHSASQLGGLPARERGAARNLPPTFRAEFFGAGSAALQSAKPSERYCMGILSMSHVGSWGNTTAMRNCSIKSAIFAIDRLPVSPITVLDCVRSAQSGHSSSISGVSIGPIVSTVRQPHRRQRT